MNEPMFHHVTYEFVVGFHEENPVSLEIVKIALSQIGIYPGQVIESEEFGRKKLCVYLTRKCLANKILSRFRRLSLNGVAAKINVLKSADWQTKWKDDFKVFDLTPRFRVIPAWEKDSYQSVRGNKPVYIDSGIAFGTGLHPTTRYIAMLIDRFEGRFQSVLDLGTGTGILTIIAHQCGGQELTALDISPDAIKTAKMNFNVNGVKKVKLIKDDIHQVKFSRQFDLVLANLITQDLIKAKNCLVRWVKPGGLLAISGISLENYGRCRREFKNFPLRCLKVERGDEWAAVMYQRQH